MPLAIVQSGRRVRIVTVNGGYRLKARLAAMGLVPGEEVKVLRSSIHGPFLVEVKDSKIMLGRGMVQKILVS